MRILVPENESQRYRIPERKFQSADMQEMSARPQVTNSFLHLMPFVPIKFLYGQAHFRNLKTFWEYSGMMKNTYDGGAVAFHHVTTMDDIFKSYSKQFLAV